MKIKFISNRLRIREEMFNHVLRWDQSGLNQPGYCDKARISRNRFLSSLLNCGSANNILDSKSSPLTENP